VPSAKITSKVKIAIRWTDILLRAQIVA